MTEEEVTEETGAPPGASASLSGMSERAIRVLVYGLSIAVAGLIAVLMAAPGLLRLEGVDVSILPAVHAAINGTTAVLLTLGYAFVRARRYRAHQRAMVTAFSLSCLFLISYVIYHSQAPESHFGGEGWVRPVYFAILISHIVLAAVILPLALFTVTRALRGEFTRHRRIARWTFPLWLYVAVTGVAVYLFMRPYYGS